MFGDNYGINSNEIQSIRIESVSIGLISVINIYQITFLITGFPHMALLTSISKFMNFLKANQTEQKIKTLFFM